MLLLFLVKNKNKNKNMTQNQIMIPTVRLRGRGETTKLAKERLKKVRKAAKEKNKSEASIIRDLIDMHL